MQKEFFAQIVNLSCVWVFKAQCMSFESYLRVICRNFHIQTPNEISDSNEDSELKFQLVAGSIHDYKMDFQIQNQRLFSDACFLKVRNFGRNFYGHKIFCIGLTNEILAKIKILRNLPKL